MPDRILKYTDALREAQDQMMEKDPSVFVIGLGVSYPKGADGTTTGLKAKYPDRVFDTPVSEASVTGMAVGAAINGLRPIVHHGRVEFALLASDAIFTQAAKWNYMFGGGNPVPAVFRINVGRQWGNGPQHTQSLLGLFGSASGLKVVIPSTPRMAKGLLVSALEDKNPVVILEPRWLFQLKEEVPAELYREPLDKARVVKKGKDITLVAYGDGFFSALQALELLGTEVDAELIDLVSINPVDYETIARSVQKTGRLLCVDTTHAAFSPGADVIAKMAELGVLRHPAIHLACPPVPCPTSTALTEDYYPTRISIANAILKVFKKTFVDLKLNFEELHLAPTATLGASSVPSPISPLPFVK